ncbi:hypothetical protein JQR88_20600 (plasmid) [Pseudomonas luteola]|uniref:hypothetical protein n=1 Tax=Pseudomonas luteola TaxID=47886 RepID=UPI003DA02C85
MKLTELEEGQLLGIELEAGELFVQFTVLTPDNERVAVFSHNRDTSKIKIRFYALSLKAGLCTVDGFATFGEIESVSCSKDRYILEGDFGAITVFADTTFIQPAPV